MKCVVRRDDDQYIAGPINAEQYGAAFLYTKNIDEAKVFDSLSAAALFVHKEAPQNAHVRAQSLQLQPVAVITTINPVGKVM